MLEQGSGIAPDVISERGYWTAFCWQDLGPLAFRGTQKRPGCFPSLVIPQHDPNAEYTYSVLRYDRPRLKANGKAIKYEQPAGVGLRLDVPLRAVPGLSDPSIPLWWTEGAKKADALASHGLVAVNTPGVDGWRSPSAIADLYGIPLSGRRIICAYDSDVQTKPAVRAAVVALARWMGQRQAQVHVLDWARLDLADGAKLGVDDFLAEHDVAEFEAFLCPFEEWAEQTKPRPPGVPYSATASGLVWHKPTREGSADVPLCNFTATIVGDVAEDDGAEIRRSFEIEARRNGRGTRFSVAAERFAGMNWITEHLGASALVYPGLALKDHTRAAIQMLSGEVPERRVYAHTGWREIDSAWAYLHAGGGIGPQGPLAQIEVSLPAQLARYVLPEPPSGDELVRAIRASLRIVKLAPPAITVPLYGGVWRAAITTADFSKHLSGPTHAGKTEFAALMQQHWGAEMDARNLPASWSSTGNSLEALAFVAKDTLLVVDDFAPTGSTADVQRYHREADRLLRAQGNNAGRQRLRPDGVLRPPKPPRGLVLSTGEDVPRGQSLRARALILELGPDDLDFGLLTECQRDAANGLYAQAMAGFVQWLAPRYDEIRRTLRDEVVKLREQATDSNMHRRTPGIVADLAFGLRKFLDYATDAGAVSRQEAEALWSEWWQALGEAAGAQGQHQAASEPTRRFLRLLSAAIVTGRAHLADPLGTEPKTPQAWGWRYVTVGTGEHERGEWRPQGDQVGWLESDDVYLDADAAYATVQRLGRDGGEGLAVTVHTLKRRLHERGLLASIEQRGGRDRLEVRRPLEGKRQYVLHLHTSAFTPPESGPSGPGGPQGHDPNTTDRRNGPPNWATNAVANEFVAHASGPDGADFEIGGEPEGPLGPQGPLSETYTLPDTPTGACRHCGCSVWWQRADGGWLCGVCHPNLAADGCKRCGERFKLDADGYCSAACRAGAGLAV